MSMDGTFPGDGLDPRRHPGQAGETDKEAPAPRDALVLSDPIGTSGPVAGDEAPGDVADPWDEAALAEVLSSVSTAADARLTARAEVRPTSTGAPDPLSETHDEPTPDPVRPDPDSARRVAALMADAPEPEVGDAPTEDGPDTAEEEFVAQAPDTPESPDLPEPVRDRDDDPLGRLTALVDAGPQSGSADLLREAYAGFAPLSERLEGLDAEIDGLTSHPDRAIGHEALRLQRKLREFEPSVVMVGQVKAGKTTLVNALTGRPGLLPADVNPWTSVVTSLHLMPEGSAGTERAAFRFFDEAAWANLVSRGGRVGELASRAGAEEELDKVRAQLEGMRQKSRQRLGRRFEMLLGQTHDYETFDEALIERYVCLGDDFWEDKDASRNKGRFADITKSADLWLNRPEVPLPLCLRDTPGVNDTFMIREQITITALRGSRLCVMVLSAQQALTTVDLALIRLVSNLKSRDIVIFVNRIDELADPAREVPEIRQSIIDTLTRYEGPADARLIFGSGHWAKHAMSGDLASLGEDSARALWSYDAAHPAPGGADEGAAAKLWRLSGVPDLTAALAERVSAGTGGQMVTLAAGGLENLSRGARAAKVVETRRQRGDMALRLPRAEIVRTLGGIEQAAMAALDLRLAEARANYEARIERSSTAFLGRATAALLKHLETYGDGVVWSYDPAGLRTLLRSACQVHLRDAGRAGDETLAQLAERLGSLFSQAIGADETGAAALTPPPLPQAPAPVSLGQTIALDLRGSWWTRFWRRTRGYGAFVDRFAKLIVEETAPIISAMKAETADRYEAMIRDTVGEFIAGQRQLLLAMAAEDKTQGDAR